MSIIALICLIIVGIISYSLIMGALIVPYVPTPTKIIKLISEKDLITDGMTIIDLGAGDGKFLRHIAKQYIIQAVGYEISPLFFAYGILLILLQKHQYKKGSRVKMLFKSYYSADVAHADIVYCYLLPKNLLKLKKIFEMMKPGSLLISYDFQAKEFSPSETIPITTIKSIYIYRR